MPATPAAAFAGDNASKTNDPGFIPDTGQINRGVDQKIPSSGEGKITISTPAEARAAMMMSDSVQPAAAPQGTDADANANANATTGSGSPVAAPARPIGAIGQTMPAKLSKRNDILDRLPIMALPQPLNDQQAVMADRAPAASDADQLAPASVNDIGGVQSLGYVKTKSKVFLVETATRIVVEEIGL